jgi:hypothetical protein
VRFFLAPILLATITAAIQEINSSTPYTPGIVQRASSAFVGRSDCLDPYLGRSRVQSRRPDSNWGPLHYEERATNGCRPREAIFKPFVAHDLMSV